MATITPSSTRRDLVESKQRVAHPLQTLRSYIRLYVCAEGLAVTLIYLAAWFWIGLILDYGIFKIFGVDWVQILPYGFRAFVLALLIAGLLAVVGTKVVLRLTREFNDASLALVLEKRFAQQLGDRLITAVELADPSIASRYGFSQAMIDATIHDAAERVASVPVAEVFNWRRLWHYLYLVLGLTVGLYLVTGAGYLGVQALRYEPEEREGASAYVHRFHHVASIWFERNVLLRDTPWPRRAYLQLLDFEGDELRIGRNAPAPTIRVRAIKWVVADNRAQEGWRPLMWDEEEIQQLVGDIAVPRFPESLWPKSSLTTGLLVDDVELQLAKQFIRDRLDPDPRRHRNRISAVLAAVPQGILPTVLAFDRTYAPEEPEISRFEKVFQALHEAADRPSMARRFRRLIVPTNDVYVLYQGLESGTDNREPLLAGENNMFSGSIPNLKESIRFTVRGADYYTPYKQITVVPPPEMTQLFRVERRPAYLYHRLALTENPFGLRGKKQIVVDAEGNPLPVSLSGDTSRLDVPTGTDVTLTAELDQRLLEKNGVVIEWHTGSARIPVEIKQIDEKHFSATFRNIVAPLSFNFKYFNRDRIDGKRRITINPLPDLPPEVDVLVEVVRKTNQGYMITPRARVPFSGKIRDAQGLSRVEYRYSYSLEKPRDPAQQIKAVAQAVSLAAAGWNGQMVAAAAIANEAAGSPQTPVDNRPLATFEQRLNEPWFENGRNTTGQRLAEALARLDAPPPGYATVDQRFIREFELNADDESFDVEALGLGVASETQLQPHYLLKLWIAAHDTNVETGPGVGESKERFTLLIVSENELITEIGKEEETLHIKMQDKGMDLLESTRTLLNNLAGDLATPDITDDQLLAFTIRAEELLQNVKKAEVVAREVSSDYHRILRELKVNRVKRGMIERVENGVCQPLNTVMSEDFPDVQDALGDLVKALRNKKPQTKLVKSALVEYDQLLARLREILANMAQITDINRLIAQLVELEKNETRQLEQLEKLKAEIEQKILEDLLNPKKK
ncbi:MAG: hypothetical protein KatS3mg105_2169 [Gemmatales bacterium]|nr:MAG: hypothetical protein KatS3mg105_2169 [Gemmatales bacterium]